MPLGHLGHDHAMAAPEQEKVSVQLEEFFGADGKKTMGGLVDKFGPRSFAIIFIVLMALPALPLPTGAVSHVLEILTMLLALELIIGRQEVWIPKRFKDKALKGLSGPKFSRALVKRIRWFEKFSRPRMAGLLENRLTGMVFGLAVFGFALTAFLSPPFSGLDTLPALGAVAVALAIILEDVVVLLIGVVLGVAGVTLIVTLGAALFRLFRSLL